MTFKELVYIAEQDTDTPGFSTMLGSLGRAASKVGNVIAAVEPGKLTNQLKNIQDRGAIGYAADKLVQLGAKLSGDSIQKFKDFQHRLSLPQGWPKKGDRVKYIGIKFKDYEGTVEKMSRVGENMVFNIRMGKPGLPNDMYAVAEIDTNATIPYSSVQKWVVQVNDPVQGYIQDEDETGHIPVLTFENGEFIFNMDSRGTAPYVLVWFDEPGMPSTITPGANVTTKDYEGNPVTGTIGVPGPVLTVAGGAPRKTYVVNKV